VRQGGFESTVLFGFSIEDKAADGRKVYEPGDKAGKMM
jgi:hypothetical protein